MDFLQKPVTYSKSLVHLSKVSMYVNEHFSAIRMNSQVSLFTNKTVKMFSHVVNITVLSVSVTWCKLWQQSGWQLLYWNAEGCTSYICHISISNVQIYTILCVGYWLKDMFELLRIRSISQYLAAPFSHCKAMIDNMVHNSGPYFIWYAPLSLASSASSSVLPLYPSTMHPYSSSSSRLLTLIIFWMFIHRQNL